MKTEAFGSARATWEQRSLMTPGPVSKSRCAAVQSVDTTH